MVIQREQKVYIDCTSTTRTNIVSGIQRVVRQLLKGVPRISSALEVEVVPICNQFGNYYTLEDAILVTEETVTEFEPIEFCYNDIYFCPDAFWSCQIFEWYGYFKSKGVLIVTTIYDLIPLDSRQFTSVQDGEYFRKAFEVVVLNSDMLISPSEATKQEVQKFLSKNAPVNCWPQLRVSKIAPIDWGENLDEALPELQENEPGFLLMVGTIEKRRGYIETIEALVPYWENGGKLKLNIVGKITDQDIANKLAQYYNKGYPIELRTGVDDVLLQQLYRRAKAILCSSLCEGYGFSVAEGLSLNGKVLANRLPVFGEFAGAMPYYFDIELPEQLLNLVEGVDRLKVVKNPQFPSWEDCYNDLINALVSLSPLHLNITNLVTPYTNKVVVYNSFLSHGFTVPDEDSVNYWINNFPDRSVFNMEIDNIACRKTTNIGIHAIYNAFGLGTPTSEICSFWKANHPELIDFVDTIKFEMSKKTTDIGIHAIYKAFGLGTPTPETCSFWKANHPELIDFVNSLKFELGI